MERRDRESGQRQWLIRGPPSPLLPTRSFAHSSPTRAREDTLTVLAKVPTPSKHCCPSLESALECHPAIITVQLHLTSPVTLNMHLATRSCFNGL